MRIAWRLGVLAGIIYVLCLASLWEVRVQQPDEEGAINMVPLPMQYGTEAACRAHSTADQHSRVLADIRMPPHSCPFWVRFSQSSAWTLTARRKTMNWIIANTLAEIVVRNWGVLITLVGAMLIFSERLEWEFRRCAFGVLSPGTRQTIVTPLSAVPGSAPYRNAPGRTAGPPVEGLGFCIGDYLGAAKSLPGGSRDYVQGA